LTLTAQASVMPVPDRTPNASTSAQTCHAKVAGVFDLIYNHLPSGSVFGETASPTDCLLPFRECFPDVHVTVTSPPVVLSSPLSVGRKAGWFEPAGASMPVAAGSKPGRLSVEVPARLRIMEKSITRYSHRTPTRAKRFSGAGGSRGAGTGRWRVLFVLAVLLVLGRWEGRSRWEGRRTNRTARTDRTGKAAGQSWSFILRGLQQALAVGEPFVPGAAERFGAQRSLQIRDRLGD